MAILSGLSKYQSTGLLILRVGIGIMIITHGYPKLMGGPELWAKVGSAFPIKGLNSVPVFWGFMAAFAEGICGLLFVLGALFRPACLLLLITMGVAVHKHFTGGDGLQGAGHALELGIVFLSMFIIGPGRFSIDKR